MPPLRSLWIAALCLSIVGPARADEPAVHATIRRNIAQRLPGFPAIDEITKSAVPGLYELRFGNDIMYTDEHGDYVIQGNVLDTQARVDLTQARLDQLNTVDFKSLPLKDAIVWRQGSGARKLVVFADPNCGYCKKLEADLQQVKDVTVYTFLVPILGGNSPEMAHHIWCAKDPAATWRSWMIQGQRPARVMGACDDSALGRNLALGTKLHVALTPVLVFEDGKRVKGVLEAPLVDRQLAASHGKS